MPSTFHNTFQQMLINYIFWVHRSLSEVFNVFYVSLFLPLGGFRSFKRLKTQKTKKIQFTSLSHSSFVSISRSFFNSLSTSFSFWIFQMHSFVYLHFAFSIILSFSWLIYSFSPVLLNLYCPFNLIIYVVLLGNVLFSVSLSLSL